MNTSRTGLLLAALALLVGTAAASAQEQGTKETAKEKKWRFAVNGGFTYSNLTGPGTDSVSLNWRWGGLVAVGAERELSPHFALALEPTLLQRGAKQTTVGSKPGLGYKLGYIEIPVLAKYNFSPGSKVEPILVAGPSVSFEVSCKQPIAVSGNVFMANCLEEPATAKTEWGGQVGVEVRYWYVNVGLRYAMSFSKLLTTEGAPDVKNHGLAAYAGVTW